MQNKDQIKLILREELFLCCGGMRACYRHPQDKSRCVKVYRQLCEIPLSSIAKRFRIFLGSCFNRFNINVQEYRFWLSIHDNEEIYSVLRPYLPKIDGLVQSNLGVALVEELILDGNGELSQNLLQLKGELTKEQLLEIQSDLRVITDCVIKHAIPMYDWNPTNILIVRDQNRCDVKIPDLEGEMGNKELIKISRWCSSARRRKLQRRISRFYTYFNNECHNQSAQA
jgi:hypothetical protein